MDGVNRIEQALDEALSRAEASGAPPRLAAALRHAVFPGGARIRPRLCLAVAQACGIEDAGPATAAAASIELLHCASLVHDDLPCFDDAPVRRGKPSVHRAFGEPLAVLAGDALIVLAFETLARETACPPLRLAGLVLSVGRAVGMPLGIVAGQHASRTGSPDGGPVRPDGGGAAAAGIRFDEPVVHNGYAWWYIDALSDDGKQGLTVIAFIGSVFSPYYAWARRRGPADPVNHCALNVVLTGPGGSRWSMTERSRRALKRDTANMEIGASSLSWDGSALTIDINETCMPIPSKIRGTVRVIPEAVTNGPFFLDMRGRHRWWPIAPQCRVEVALTSPDRSWSGTGYFDTNTGDEALEDAFTTWDWCRGSTNQGASILYNVERRSGPPLALALAIDRTGGVEQFEPLPVATLPTTRWWRIPRQTRADPGQSATVAETLVDAPFYARSVLSTHIKGQPVTAMHESLSLDRFRTGWVQALLPFRMPRVP